ncbi:MAG: phosphate ABC transporter ATP-binding protein PstB [Hyphomicrobium aestuarii]|nr:phosphate ABC transporter ATP-binding protein PstB [Hyphomicrobium aestuarii]
MQNSPDNFVVFKIHLGPKPFHESRNKVKIDIQNVNFWYGEKQALTDISLKIHSREVTAFIGPSGCGKTTLLRCLNRSHDDVPGARLTGTILVDGLDINDVDLDPPIVRRRFGWVAQKPNPFPQSVYDNIAYGPRIHGLVSGTPETDSLVESCLQRVGLWDEVKNRLGESGLDLSGGQQQRLCIARAIAYNPEVILMDEPASSLDPIATARIEALIDELRASYTIVLITHNMQQAARVSQRVAVFHLGRLVEQGDTTELFVSPKHEITKAYITGRFG